MHYAILNRSGNALEWFTDETEARDALAEIMAEYPDADVDLVAFARPDRPAEPVSPSARSAWPSSRLVWSNHAPATATVGSVGIIATVTSDDLDEPIHNATDDRVKQEA